MFEFLVNNVHGDLVKLLAKRNQFEYGSFPQAMKTSLFALSLFAMTLGAKAELLFTWTETNKITLTNAEVIVISRIYSSNVVANISFKQSNITTSVRLASELQAFENVDAGSGQHATAFAGPCEITFNSPSIVNFTRIVNSAFKTVVADPQVTVNVPAGKTIRCFRVPTETASSLDSVRIQRGAAVYLNRVPVFAGDQFTGPMQLTIKGTTGEFALTYYETDDFVEVASKQVLQGPTGTFEIAVEKTADLVSWTPVMVQLTGSDERAFYRMRIRR